MAVQPAAVSSAHYRPVVAWTGSKSFPQGPNAMSQVEDTLMLSLFVSWRMLKFERLGDQIAVERSTSNCILVAKDSLREVPGLRWILNFGKNAQILLSR
jgi:hypothetical protein